MNCKFWIEGYCCHKDAPKTDISCIGKDACEAWHDDISYYSESNYQLAKELIKAKVN